MHNCSGRNCILALVILLCFAAVTPGVAGAQAIYRISDKAIQQAKDAAARESLRSLSQRRPKGLTNLGSDEAVSRTIEESMQELGHDDREVQSKAFGKLKYLGDLAFPDLVEGLKSENPVIRKWCAKLLGRRGSAAVLALSRVVRADSTSFVRFTAAMSLGQIFDPRAVLALLTALEDEDFHVSIRAIRALAYLENAQAFEPLKEILDDFDVDSQLREAAARALLQIDRDAGQRAIREVLLVETSEWKRHNFGVVLKNYRPINYWPPDMLDVLQLTRDASTFAGEGFGTEELQQLLQHIDSPDSTVSSGCLRALDELNAISTVHRIIAVAPEGSSLYALAKIASPEAVSYLLDAIQSPDDTIRKPVIRALGEQGGRWAVPILIELLDDPSLRITGAVEPAQIDGGGITWPDEHWAHSALFSCLSRAGLKGVFVNLATHATFDVDDEVRHLKAWSIAHGEDFLAGKSVPNPRVSSAGFIS